MRSMPPLALSALTALAVVGIIVLTMTGHNVPEVLAAIALGGLTGAAGATHPAPAAVVLPAATGRHADDQAGPVVDDAPDPAP